MIDKPPSLIIGHSETSEISDKEVISGVHTGEKISIEDGVFTADNVVVETGTNGYLGMETRLVLDEIDNTTCKNKKMLKHLCCAVKDLKKDYKHFADKALTGIEHLKLKEEEESKMMYSNCVEAVPTVAVVGNGGCNGCHNQQPMIMPTNGGGLFGNDGMGGGLLGGLLFGALLGGGGLFGRNGFGANAAGFDGLGSGSTATVAATDFGVANLLSNLNGTIATEIATLGTATANQTQLLSKEIASTTDTLLQQGHASSYQIQDKLNSNIIATLGAVDSVRSDLCGLGQTVLQESCANQRVTEAVGANLANGIANSTMSIKDQANANFIAGMTQANNQFMSLKDCCCETQQAIANGNFALSNQMCNGFNDVERDVWSTSSAIQAQNCANTAAIQAQACSNTATLEKTMFQNALGAERQLNCVARDMAECCCEQKLLNTMGFANIQNSLKDGFCDLKADLARDKIEELRIANAANRDALNQKALADAINVTLTNGFTQLGAVFTSNVIPAIQAAVKTA